jgi:hypothetical protein
MGMTGFVFTGDAGNDRFVNDAAGLASAYFLGGIGDDYFEMRADATNVLAEGDAGFDQAINTGGWGHRLRLPRRGRTAICSIIAATRLPDRSLATTAAISSSTTGAVADRLLRRRRSRCLTNNGLAVGAHD